MNGPRLSQTALEQIYKDRIKRDFLADARPADAPVAMFIAGQPGAGVPLVSAALRRELTRSTGPVVQLSEDRLRPYHPAWRAGTGGDTQPLRAGTVQPEIDYWFG